MLGHQFGFVEWIIIAHSMFGACVKKMWVKNILIPHFTTITFFTI